MLSNAGEPMIDQDQECIGVEQVVLFRLEHVEFKIYPLNVTFGWRQYTPRSDILKVTSTWNSA